MNTAYEWAKLLKERENEARYSPMEGLVASLPDLKIQINEKVVLGKESVRSVVNLYARDSDGNYLWRGRRVYLLPWPGNRKFLVIGGDEI